MTSDYLSDTFLFYSPGGASGNNLFISGDEAYHALRVLRLREGSDINVTDGKGKIFKCTIGEVRKDGFIAAINEQLEYINKIRNLTICLPLLKSSDRFEFGIEKCTELGITNFIFYSAQSSPKSAFKKERIDKILISAMKQSLRAFLPEYKIVKSVLELSDLPYRFVELNQHSDQGIDSFIPESDVDYAFLIGPEAGFTESEISSLPGSISLRLNEARLRTESAAITCATILTYRI